MHFFCDYFSMALQMAKKEQTPRDKRPNGVCESLYIIGVGYSVAAT